MSNSSQDNSGVQISLKAQPERQLIRPTGSKRHIAYTLRVEKAPQQADTTRRPLALALVLDRSGSMQGEPLRTAKRAAVAIIEQLDERDRLALVVFDERIDVLQQAATVTAEVKRQARAALAEIEARGSTALYEGWLTGCEAIAANRADEPDSDERRLSHCFLLTDGLANIGESDPERIASRAADIRDNTGIGTSTFGCGDNYDERLLGPMAVAGGGQFHHLRNATDIASTFGGEFGDLLKVAAMQVRLEIEAQPGMTAEVISAYRQSEQFAHAPHWLIGVGDLLGGDERHIVLRFSFPHEDKAYSYTVRARVLWSDNSGEQQSEWQDVAFTYGTQHACDDEPRDPAIMHWVGLDYADRAKREAIEHSKRGDVEGARQNLLAVARRISAYAGADAELHAAVRELESLAQELSHGAMRSAMSKELYFRQQSRSRGQKDYRNQQ